MWSPCATGWPVAGVWLVLRRGRGATQSLKTHLCNVPAEVAKETLVWLPRIG